MSVKQVDDVLSELKKRRGSVKGRLTQFKNVVDSFVGANLTALQVAELKLRVQAAIETFAKFNAIENEIELLLSESETSANSEYVEVLESIYFTAMASANCLIHNAEACSEFPIASARADVQPRVNIKLPDIKLPAFEGAYDHWLEFKHSYITMIHNRSDLDEIQKFHYLRSALSGSALQVISALEFSPANYIHAWELLENRYHNERLLINNHVKALHSIPSLKQESPSQIRKLIDTILRNLRALKSLNEPTVNWDTLIIYLIVNKLDPSTEREWENHIGATSLGSRDKVKLNDLISFLRSRADTLEMINTNHARSKEVPQNDKHQHTSDKRSSNRVHSYSSIKPTRNNDRHNKFKKEVPKCVLCDRDHALYTCITFLNMSVKDRMKVVTDKKLCGNCLRAGHTLNDCIFGPCKQCQRKHNSLLHLENQSVSNSACVRNDSRGEVNETHTTTTALHSSDPNNTVVCDKTTSDFILINTVLLSTALVEVADDNNVYHTARALLDSGSQNCFVTEKLSKQINASYIQSIVQISGVGQSVTQSCHSCDISIRSKVSDYYTKLRCIVLPCITSSLPTINIEVGHIRIPEFLQLADPTFNVSSEIDLLIGADRFWDLLETDKIRLASGPFLQNSKLGWLLSGPVFVRNSKPTHVRCHFSQGIDKQLRLFWEIENIPSSPRVILTDDERTCEELFNNTTKREEDGRFSVRIPLREDPSTLGDSYTLATRRFLTLERKLEHSPEFKRMYTNFMREYNDLGHMSKLVTCSPPNYYLPHHGVVRESSTTTRLRIVFDASAVTSSNKSLNDIQYPGPALQNDIFSILLRFRQYKYVACADVEKMFRQVLLQSDQRSLQLILWRDNPSDPLDTYQLNTVTYGTASAPYLSMRCIRQLALECDDDVIARVITQDIFVDDLITGDDDLDNLILICQKTSDVLQSGCFPLRKWTFNSDVSQNKSTEHFIGEHEQTKTLGLGWHNTSDELHFVTKIDNYDNSTNLTKRVMLSVISQIYDPLGLLSPAVIISKIILQKLWLSKIDWDTSVPKEIANTWKHFIFTLRYLKDIRIRRHVKGDHTQYTELHIFTDASQEAYGACAYLRTYSDSSDVTVRLLCAKSKVAPLKAISIPRLELCGALIGAKLYKKITESLRLQFSKIYFWTDSTIVMGWIKMSPHLLKTFVQNRVTEINELTGDSVWLHVSSKDNPADLLSRGCSLDLLKDSDLWWHGPSYLHNRLHYFDQTKCDNTNVCNLPDLKCKQTCLPSIQSEDLINFEKYASFTKLKRIGAYILRFIDNARVKSNSRKTGSLSVSELTAAQRMLIRLVQVKSFPDVYNNLVSNIPIKRTCKQYNKVSSLNVFMDEHKIIRVGGRLFNVTSFTYDKKHPVLLCSKHPFTICLFRYEHIRLLHAGPQLLLATVRECWWPLNARNLARKIVHECVKCTRVRGKTLAPIMGNLPPERLEPGYPFMRTGVDYAGPVFILTRKGRGSRLTKAYICLFICFTTRAMHLELVTSLSTNDYILALRPGTLK